MSESYFGNEFVEQYWRTAKEYDFLGVETRDGEVKVFKPGDIRVLGDQVTVEPEGETDRTYSARAKRRGEGPSTKRDGVVDYVGFNERPETGGRSLEELKENLEQESSQKDLEAAGKFLAQTEEEKNRKRCAVKY